MCWIYVVRRKPCSFWSNQDCTYLQNWTHYKFKLPDYGTDWLNVSRSYCEISSAAVTWAERSTSVCIEFFAPQEKEEENQIISYYLQVMSIWRKISVRVLSLYSLTPLSNTKQFLQKAWLNTIDRAYLWLRKFLKLVRKDCRRLAALSWCVETWKLLEGWAAVRRPSVLWVFIFNSMGKVCEVLWFG